MSGHNAPHATDLHRLFIQSILSRRAMKDHVALELYKRAVGACQAHDDTFRPTHPTTMQGFRAFANDVSDILHDLGMEVSIGSEQTERGRQWVILKNIDPTDVALHATDLAPNEIDLFRKVIEGIITAYPANSIGHLQALSLVSDLETQMTKHAAELILEALCSRGWLIKSKRGRYSLGVRGVVELEPYLKQEYEDWMHSCRQCKRIILAGVACSAPNCSAHFHPYCYTSICRLPRPSCPDCSTRFDDSEPNPIGEKAVPRAEDEFSRLRKRKRPSAAGQGKGKGRAAQADGDEEGEETDEDDDAEPEESAADGGSGYVDGTGPSGWRVDSSSRKRKDVIPETQYDDDDDDEDEEGESGLPPPTRRKGGPR